MTRPSAAKHAPGARRAPFALLLLGLVVGGMCALLALNTASAANEVQRHGIASQDQAVAAQLVQLQNDQQASAAPGNLAVAAAALGMVPAGNPAFLEIGANGKVRLLGSPAAASYVPVPVPAPTPTPTKTAKSTTKPAPKHGAKHTARHRAKHNSTKAKKKTVHPTTTTTTTPTPTPSPTPNSFLPGGTR